MHQIAAPTLRGPSDTLASAGPARPRPFLLAVPGASARGVETRGVDAVARGSTLVLGGLSVRDAACSNVLLAPAHARRELIGPFGSAMEVLLLAPDGLVAQWTAGAALELEMTVPGAAATTQGARLTVVGSDAIRVVEIEPAPEWSVRSEAGRTIARARVEAPNNPIRLLATGGADTADLDTALDRLSRAREAHAESDAHALRDRRLATRTGIAELDDGLAWAGARLDAALDAWGRQAHELAAGEPFPFDPDSRRAWTTLGALASGAERVQPPEGSSELELLVRARAATWRGRRSAAPAELPAPSTDPAQNAARRAALLALADAVEPWEGKERAKALRDAAAARKGPVALPTLGGSGSSDPLAAALDLPGRVAYAAPTEDPPVGVRRALAAWACLNDGALDRGFELFRRHLADGFAGGVGLWPDAQRVHDAAAAALVPLVFLEGLLGARGDAHYGRLRLSPRLPGHWTRLVTTGITLGDATVRLEYERAAGTHVFRVRQERGAVPLMLIFEPLVEAGSSPAVRIDGAPAQVDVTAVAGRAQTRVQLPLDREREISIG